MPIAGRDANVYITAATATTSTGEAFSLVSGSTVSYQIDSTAARHWDRNPGTTGRPIVYVGATTSTGSYTVNYVQGIITFTTSPASAVTADVEYLTASAVGGGREWTLNIERDLFEVSDFSSTGWRNFIQMMSGGTVSIGNYWTDSSIFDTINVDRDLIVELYPKESTGDRYEAYGYVSNDQIGAGVEGVVGETFDIQLDGTVYWTTAA